jgi:hypothetical protein
MIGHFIGITFYIWYPFFIAFWFVKYAVIYNANIPHNKNFDSNSTKQVSTLDDFTSFLLPISNGSALWA